MYVKLNLMSAVTLNQIDNNFVIWQHLLYIITLVTILRY